MCLLSALESSVFSSYKKKKPQVWQDRKQQTDGTVIDFFLLFQPQSWTSGLTRRHRPTVPSTSESSSEGLRYSFLFLFLMGFRWSGLREDTLPPAGTFSTPILLLGCRHIPSLDCGPSPSSLFVLCLFVPHGEVGGFAAVFGEPYWSKRCLGSPQNSSRQPPAAGCPCACSQLISGNGEA